MNGYVRMSFAEVEQLVSNLTTGAQQNLDNLNSLTSRANPTEVWEGRAAQSYTDAFERWKKAQIEAQSALTALGHAVQTIKQNFEAVNNQGADGFSQFYQ